MRISELRCEYVLSDYERFREFPFCIDNAAPRFSFNVEGTGTDTEIKYYKIFVSSSPELLEDKIGDMWDSGLIYSSDTRSIVYGGKELCENKDYYFQFYAMVGKTPLKSRVGIFHTGIKRWHGSFIAAPAQITEPSPEAEGVAGGPAPYFRRDINIKRRVRHAYAYASALGVYDLYINGERWNKSRLSPGWTKYGESLQYQYYDLSGAFKEGTNTIGAIVGDGWYKSYLCGVGREQYGDRAGFLFDLTVEYDDGSVSHIGTDENWQCFSGAYVYTDNQNGEFFDARLIPDGWSALGYKNDGMTNVEKYYPPLLSGARLKAHIGPQIRDMMNIKPISITEKNGAYIVDMGQNMVGVLNVKLHGSRGDRVTFRFGEMLNDADKGERGCDGDAGTLYTANLRSAKQTDTYICRGKNDVYEPRFTWHGFRYAEIKGLKKAPAPEDITGCVIYSACDDSGMIRTSNELINKLISNVTWGQRGNFVGLPTDCPQRDERLGWTGDSQVFCRSACYNMNCAAFYEKYTEDIFESQKPDGSITDIAPMIKHKNGWDLVGNSNAAWGDAAFVIPYTVYEMYNDKRILELHYADMKRYYEKLLSTTSDLIRPSCGYGDWLSVDDDTDLGVLATAFFAYDAYLMKNIANVLDKKEDEAYFSEMFEKTALEWREKYTDGDGRIFSDTQTCYLMALKFGLLPECDRKTAAAHLVRKIEEKNYHLSTGFIGVSYLLPVLCDIGREDIAYRILLNDTYPSCGYSIKNGATTIWERWNSYTKENGFGDVSMNSFNHYSLGSCIEWMYSYMLGIKPVEPGFSKFSVAPYFDPSVGAVSGEYASISGKIVVEWRAFEKKYELKVTVPANTTAYVSAPGRIISILDGERTKKNGSAYECKPGTYLFTVLK